MFGINANLKKAVAVATIATAGILGAANASAQQLWMEEVIAQQEAQQGQDAQATETADRKAEEKADSNAS